MASSLNLLDLVNHLHNLESSVGRILIEAAVKLSQLTDLNLFVIVESQDGRKFAGTRDLCDAYVASALNPCGNDVHINVLDNQTVVEEPLNVMNPVPEVSRAVAGRGAAPSIAAVPSSLVSTPLSSSSSSSHSAERKRRSHPPPDFTRAQPKVRKLDDATASSAADNGVKLESDCHIISDDENETINDVRTFDAFPQHEPEMSSESFHCPTSNLAMDHELVPSPNGAIAVRGVHEAEDWRQGGNKMFIGPLLPPITLDETLCHKMRGLNSINNSNVFDKNTTEYRLFASTVYDFGKHIYHYAPSNKDIKDLTVLAFITECVEGFLRQHPFLAESDSYETKVNGLTVTGFIRDRVKGGFKKKLMRSLPKPLPALLSTTAAPSDGIKDLNGLQFK